MQGVTNSLCRVPQIACPAGAFSHQQDEGELALAGGEAALRRGGAGVGVERGPLQAIEALCEGAAAGGQGLAVQKHAEQEEELVLPLQQLVQPRPALRKDLRGAWRRAGDGRGPGAPGVDSQGGPATGSLPGARPGAARTERE